MKNVFYFLFLFCNINLFAQSFLPFQSNSHKLYRDQNGSTFSLVFQHVDEIFNDSLFIPTLNVNSDFFNSDTCIFWGGGCHKQNQPGWLGKKVKTNNLGKYTFYQVNGDSLSFDFNTNQNDTSLIFQNNTEILKMSFANSAFIQVLGFADSVNYYNLYHTDVNGNPINSGLNQYQLCVGKSIGLINFFNIANFPLQVDTLSLLGNQNPNIGYYKITNEMIYDYAVGDEYQYYNGSSYSNPSWGWSTGSSSYVKYTILNKSLTPDSIIYFCLRNTFEISTNSQFSDSVYLRYSRNQGLAGIPYEIFDGQFYKSFLLGETCGISQWELNRVSEPYNLAYCAIDTCWGGIDTQGPAATVTIKHVLGYGQTKYHDELFGGFNFTSHYIISDLIYSLKNGQACGAEQIVGDAALVNRQSGIKFSPNPANSIVNIHYQCVEKGKNSRFSIINLQGQVVLEKIVSNDFNSFNNLIMDVSELADGFYLLNFEQNGILIQSSKLVKN